jgi:proline dehydrogenase
MEGSGLVDRTLNTFESIWQEGHRNLGVVLQSYLYRTDDDLQRVLSLGARIRLVKGAYKEKPDVAYPDKTDVDAAFVRHARELVSHGSAPAFATHDPRMIDAVCAQAKELGIGKGGFEFQMLYGVRRDLQRALVGNGFSVRVYVPFGSDWFPYFMRRLAERPANVGFVLKSLMYEQKG